MSMTKVCLDVGGTEIKGAVVSSGELLTEISHFPARSGEEKDVLLEHFEKVIRALASKAGQTLDGLSLAFPGPFDYENGICLMRGLDKYDAWYNVNLREELFRRLADLLPDAQSIRFINDAAAFALGEIHFGHAKGSGRSMAVCIGTGCGSAFGLKNGLAPEGTLGVPPNGYIYPFPLLEGCIDDYISKRGVMRLTKEWFGKAMEGAELSALVLSDDTRAAACFAEFGERLCDALEPFLYHYRPDCLCMGGQITRSFSMFGGPLQDLCTQLGVRLFVTADTSKRAIQGLYAL